MHNRPVFHGSALAEVACHLTNKLEVATVEMVHCLLLRRNSAIKAVNAEMSGSTADLPGIAGAFGGAFTRVTGAVRKLIPTEALAAVLSTGVLGAYRVTVCDAVA